MHEHLSTRGPRRKRMAEGLYIESGNWVAIYRDHDGRQRSKTLPLVRNLTEARKARHTLLADLEARRIAHREHRHRRRSGRRVARSRTGRVRPRTYETDCPVRRLGEVLLRTQAGAARRAGGRREVPGRSSFRGGGGVGETAGGVDGDERTQDAAHGHEQGGAGRDDCVQPSLRESPTVAFAAPADERSSGPRPQRPAGRRAGRGGGDEDAELRGRDRHGGVHRCSDSGGARDPLV